ncbi:MULTISPECIES: hypothetical protein [unclassified Nodularia (in: cyanobacteria)]|uniref:hypothetical protein n=1 Tax=unclassified Nodularia (in: cyanobacteria) TaxID=2656917 RepID=UPI001D12155C|nr:hypothetical protein [Nodularia sp. LEGE 04288]MCC2695778.1 hypothetical protein [Nodularia sp. LEGE 04288]
MQNRLRLKFHPPEESRMSGLRYIRGMEGASLTEAPRLLLSALNIRIPASLRRGSKLFVLWLILKFLALYP